MASFPKCARVFSILPEEHDQDVTPFPTYFNGTPIVLFMSPSNRNQTLSRVPRYTPVDAPCRGSLSISEVTCRRAVNETCVFWLRKTNPDLLTSLPKGTRQTAVRDRTHSRSKIVVLFSLLGQQHREAQRGWRCVSIAGRIHEQTEFFFFVSTHVMDRPILINRFQAS